MRCIYCNATKDLTSSDIIPYAITGAKITRTFVCHKHNAYTNDSYESKFISDMDFFRNELGLSTRDGKPIQFKANLSIGDETLFDVKLSGHKSLNNLKKAIATRNAKGEKVLIAPKELFGKSKRFKPIPIKEKTVTLHKTITAESFLGYYAIHTIAKTAYEWHCYINNVDGYEDEYQEIVDYILGNSAVSPVGVITEPYQYLPLDQISRIGTNALFEYDDIDGYKYVVFFLWNIIAYKVRICKSSIGEAEKPRFLCPTVYLYQIDGVASITAFATMSVYGDATTSIQAIAPETINADQWTFFTERLGQIFTTVNITPRFLIDNITKAKSNLQKYQTTHDFLEFLEYEDKNLITALSVIDLLYNSREKYDETKSIIENIRSLANESDGMVSVIPGETKDYVSKLRIQDEEGNLFNYLSPRIDFFEKAWEGKPTTPQNNNSN